MTMQEYHTSDAWDGQLPLADLVHDLRTANPDRWAAVIKLSKAAPPTGPQPYWPSVDFRIEWAIEQGILQDLTAVQLAVLQHICLRAGGRADIRGCLQSQGQIALETRYKLRVVNRAVKELAGLNLIAIRKHRNNDITTWPNPVAVIEYGQRQSTADFKERKADSLLVEILHAKWGDPYAPRAQALRTTDTQNTNLTRKERKTEDDSSSSSVGSTIAREAEIRAAASEFPAWLASWKQGEGAMVRHYLEHWEQFERDRASRRAVVVVEPTSDKYAVAYANHKKAVAV